MNTRKTLMAVAICLVIAGAVSAAPIPATTVLQIAPNPATLSGDSAPDVTFTTTTTRNSDSAPVTQGNVILQWGSDGYGVPVPSTYAGTIVWMDFGAPRTPNASGQTIWLVDLDPLFLPGTTVAIRANYAPAGSGYREHKSLVQDLVIAVEGTWVKETAWAAGLPYNPEDTGGNWATYTPYEGEAKTVTLYAGQDMPAGSVLFSAPVSGVVTITISLNAGWRFYDEAENVKIQDYDTAPSGNPAPGQFDTKGYAAGSPFPIDVPENDFYGVHVDVEWLDLGE